MAIATDFVSDISAHVLWGKTLAKNLCTEYDNCTHPHSLPVPLNDVSERKIAGDGSGEAVCFICEVHCDHEHSDFKLFCIAF
jgi:hypothetical protein